LRERAGFAQNAGEQLALQDALCPDSPPARANGKLVVYILAQVLRFLYNSHRLYGWSYINGYSQYSVNGVFCNYSDLACITGPCSK